MSSLSEDLLEIVYSYPILYDLSHKDYKQLKKKDKIWDEIGRDLKVSGNTVKKRWKNLRDAYAKFLRNTKTTTGQEKKGYKRWQWASQMERYKPFLHMAQTSLNISPTDLQKRTMENADVGEDEYYQSYNENATEEFSLDLPENDALQQYGVENFQPQNLPGSSQQLNSSGKQNSAKIQKLNPTIISNTDRAVQYLENSNGNQLDAIDYLMLSYGITIKQFSLQRQAETKMEFAQIIMRKEIEQIQENESCLPSFTSSHSRL